MYRAYFKRLFDLVLAIPAFLIISPIFLLTACLLSFVIKGTPFFFQKRPGYKAKIFRVIKFKTMNDRKDASGNLLPDAIRLTPVGRFIRKTSLDEIPQLLNVIKGDMSLVGPRPLLVEYLPLYSEEQNRRHDVKPGITGWAQVNGRNALSWKEKFEKDVWYIDNLSFILDLQILFLTIKKVLIREGISGEGQATAVAFNGRN